MLTTMYVDAVRAPPKPWADSDGPDHHVDAGGRGTVEGEERGADHGRRREPEGEEGQHRTHRARLHGPAAVRV